MECNKEEGRRAMNIAERKLSVNDYVGAKKFIKKAQSLYPNLEGLREISLMIDVFISGGESDWYGILDVDPLADDKTVKKQYKKLALLLHPDKNRFNGAEEAFKLVSEAWCVLSDKSKRILYDRERRTKQQVNTQNKKSSACYSTPEFDDFVKRFFEKERQRMRTEQESREKAAREAKAQAQARARAQAKAKENKKEACPPTPTSNQTQEDSKTEQENRTKAAKKAPAIQKKSDSQERVKSWLRKAQREIDAAIAIASARAKNKSKASPPTPTPTSNQTQQASPPTPTSKQAQEASPPRPTSDQAQKQEASSSSSNQGQERVRKWLEKSRRNLDAALAAAAARIMEEERQKRWFEKSQKDLDAALAAAAARKSEEERRQRWFEKSQKDLETALAAAAARIMEESKNLKQRKACVI